MKSIHRITRTTLWLASALFIASVASAQQNQTAVSAPATSAYSIARETVLSGTVASFTEGAPRVGAQLTLGTSSGLVTVNVGNAKLLSLNGMVFNPGEPVRITGESVTVSGTTVFVARIVQKGSQSLTVRNEHGFMAHPTRSNLPASASKQGGVL